MFGGDQPRSIQFASFHSCIRQGGSSAAFRLCCIENQYHCRVLAPGRSRGQLADGAVFHHGGYHGHPARPMAGNLSCAALSRAGPVGDVFASTLPLLPCDPRRTGTAHGTLPGKVQRAGVVHSAGGHGRRLGENRSMACCDRHSRSAGECRSSRRGSRPFSGGHLGPDVAL